ncbi:DEAD/DEAH box helicase family protein [Anaerolineales bacterium HSG6]|nr:DEAD/DEAH box helicase family protein [Anaerolineales bacterium HSG6]MDM8531872.1 DEAD/DEAH box helicase family protein [Anaerolineales bacterium HSG25]
MSKSNKKITYEDYYTRTIDERSQSDNLMGLKLVVGPTGLGKTFAIPLVIQNQRQKGHKVRYIYTSHRHFLIEEMEKGLDEHDIPSVYLNANDRIVTDFINGSNVELFLNTLDKKYKFFEPTGKTVTDVNELAKNISGIQNEIKRNKPSILRKKNERYLKDACSDFLRLFEVGLKSVDENKHSNLLQNEQIWQLFPYIKFLKDENRPVLLVTVQKLLYGFFDGKSKQSIISLSDKIIFLDEFEVQESVILKAMCAHDGIRNNFEFVRLFHNEVTTQQQLGNLTSDNDSVKIVKQLQTELTRNGYEYPPIFRFTMGEDEFEKKDGKSKIITIFQSRHIIQTTPFYFKKETEAWRIVKPKTGQSVASRQMLYTISRITDEILEFFAELWATGAAGRWQEWIDLCYNERNDTINGEYSNIIKRYGAFKRPLRFFKMRNREAIQDSIYYKGFSLHKLTRGKYQHISPDEVRIQQKTLQITPEYILWQLCQSNLVFCISATGDIPRYINAFDLRWLEKNTPYIPISTQDKALIAEMKRKKRAKREYQGQSYTIRLEYAEYLPDAHKLRRFLEGLDAEGFFDKKPTDKTTARVNTVDRFLETARWVVNKSDNQAHLVFVNSFAYIKKLLNKKQELHVEGRDDLTQHLIVQQGEHNQEYQLIIDSKPCYVVLLNAQKAKEAKDKVFTCDTHDSKLIVVTQYESAALGVNLEWRNIDSEGQDFQGIHLLEAKHFYFNTQKTEDDDSNLDIEKMFNWQIWKLSEGRMISYSQFLHNMNQGHIARFNANTYKNTSDYLLNQVALFHQAFGRVDRKWQPTKSMDVRLANSSSVGNANDGVFGLLERYLSEDEVIIQQRTDREDYTSDLILNIHKEIEKKSRRKLLYNQINRQDISNIQDRCRQRIQGVLGLIDQMKKGAYDNDVSERIKLMWLNVRRAMLNQDYLFQDELLGVDINFKRDFIFSAKYLQKNDKLYVNEGYVNTVFRDYSIDTQEYSLNWPYRQFFKNDVIKQDFITRGYKLQYLQTVPNYVFAPHAIQAILAGAVGEVTLESLLRSEKISINKSILHPTPLFEVFDIKITGKPIYLDAKSFSQHTIYRMNAQPDDPEYNEDLNGATLLRKAQKKWREIANYTKEVNTKFVIVNLQNYSNGLNEYWDENLIPVSTFDESAITLIQGAIDPTIQDPNNPAQLQPSFRRWLSIVQDF